jgi:RNA polymerase sigma-B factor
VQTETKGGSRTKATARPATKPQEQALALQTEQELLDAYCETHDPRLESELANRFMPLARSLAFRYRGGVERTEDLIQVASLGLVKALRGYDPERGRRFAAYAAPTILGELRRHFRDHSWRLHVPRGVQELSLAVEKASSKLSDDLGHTPSVRELAEYLEVPDERILDVLEAKESQRSVSLDVPRHRGEDEAAPMIEAMGDDDDGFDTVESQLAVEQCAGLDDRERQVVAMYFSQECNQSEIGERIGVSQMQVSRILRKALAKMLEAVQGEEHPDGKRTFDRG